MALVLGTNCGFVTTAPTSDPGGTNPYFNMSGTARVIKDTTPSNSTKITEVGFWCDAIYGLSVNFEVGLYAADGESVPGEAGELLFSDTTNTLSSSGWNTVPVDWEVSAETDYWIGIQVDDAGGTIYLNYSSTGSGRDTTYSTSLPDPFDGGSFNTGTFAFYALVETESTGTNCKINIGDTFKDVDSMKINIGDSWKDVESVQINIGDSWKTVFS